MLFIKPGVCGTGGRCHTPSGQEPVKCTAGGPETPPACAGVKQSGPLIRRLHLTGSMTAGSRGPGHLPHTRLPYPLPCDFFIKKHFEGAPFKVNHIQLELLQSTELHARRSHHLRPEMNSPTASTPLSSTIRIVWVPMTAMSTLPVRNSISARSLTPNPRARGRPVTALQRAR